MNEAQRYQGLPATKNPESVISRLDQIHKILGEAESTLTSIAERLDGSYLRPDIMKEAEPPTDSVASRLLELNARAQRIAQAVSQMNTSIGG